MMVTIFLLAAVLISTSYTSAQSFTDDQKIRAAVASQVSAAFVRVKLTCTTITARGRLAACPAGFQVTGCSCGYACGSWDIRSGNVCHCQCRKMDWASARCCKTVIR